MFLLGFVVVVCLFMFWFVFFSGFSTYIKTFLDPV